MPFLNIIITVASSILLFSSIIINKFKRVSREFNSKHIYLHTFLRTIDKLNINLLLYYSQYYKNILSQDVYCGFNHIRGALMFVVELTNKVESKKIQQLENVVKAMCRKFLSFECEMKDLKNKQESEEEPSFNINDIYYCSSTPKDDKEKVKKDMSGEDLLFCTECSYTCKKEK